ncbi:MAG: ATP-binding protein, partial [Bacteroidota bacterium]
NFSKSLVIGKSIVTVVPLTCYEEEGLMNILVHDNGKGFDVSKVTEQQNGIGLSSLKSLTEKCEGEINFDSHAVSGTTVTIDLPITSDFEKL